MTISISNLTVAQNAPTGTVVGRLTTRDQSGKFVASNFTLTKTSAGFFAVSGSNLITAWSGTAPAGNYSVRVNAVGTNVWYSAGGSFVITIM